MGRLVDLCGAHAEKARPCSPVYRRFSLPNFTITFLSPARTGVLAGTGSLANGAREMPLLPLVSAAGSRLTADELTENCSAVPERAGERVEAGQAYESR